MHKYQEQLTHAHSLRTAILAAPEIWLPRRAVLLDWLDGFLSRVVSTEYELSRGDTTDLNALDGFLRKRKVPVAPGAA